MTRIARNPARAAEERYDIAILGGGIYGAMLLLIAAAKGLRAILLERSDFGGATSFNSLKIIHGGLRYLQSADLGRSRAMIRERAWFLRAFPDLTVPLPCLLPLYDRGLQRRSTLRAALWMDAWVSRSLGELTRHTKLAAGRLVSPGEVRDLFPLVNDAGLKGGAIWCDAHVPDTQRLVMETLRWAVSLGGSALNYVQAGELRARGDRVEGVLAHDRLSQQQIEIRADVIVNATGPWSRRLARRYDRDVPELFRPSLAWNLLLDRPPLSDHALAVSPPQPHARTYFLVPWKGKILAGTGHGRLSAAPGAPVTDEAIDGMIDDLNAAVPGLDLASADVARVLSGLLPVRHDGTVELASREIVYDHGRRGGPDGLFSVSGVKLVAAHAVAEKTLRAVCERFFRSRAAGSLDLRARPAAALDWNVAAAEIGRAEQSLQGIIDNESVIHLDDLVFRRTTLWEEPDAVVGAAPRLCSLFAWDASVERDEASRLEALLRERAPEPMRPTD